MSDISSSDKESVDSDVEDVIEMKPMELQNKRISSGANIVNDVKNMSLNINCKFKGNPAVTSPDFIKDTAYYNKPQAFTRTMRTTNPPDQRLFPAVIPLNVGGLKYMTRLSTLTKYPDSMLAAMFSGRHDIDKDEYGNYFLDSNGSLFGYILEYLRTSTLPPNHLALAVFREANYYGLVELTEKLQFKPEIATLNVRECHRNQFPNYYETKVRIIQTAMNNAIQTRLGEVLLYVFKTEFVPKTPNFNPKHGCVADSAELTIGPWTTTDADEEVFMKCLETDLSEDGFTVKPHEPRRKCRYFHGQTCQKAVYKLQFYF